MSPVVLRIGRYRFFFYASDAPEPPHVHVTGGGGVAKFWLGPPVVLTSRAGYDDHEVRAIERLIVERRVLLEERWHGFFDRD